MLAPFDALFGKMSNSSIAPWHLYEFAVKGQDTVIQRCAYGIRDEVHLRIKILSAFLPWNDEHVHSGIRIESFNPRSFCSPLGE